MAIKLQMNWEKSSLNNKINQRRKRGSPPLGLRNLGNSCYLNSVLQCLTYTPPLANLCLDFLHSSLCDSALDIDSKRDCPFCILEKRIARSLCSNLVQDSPSKIQSCLRIFADHFRLGKQEDAHEFLRYVIDACHNSCLRLKKLRRNNNGGESSLDGNTIVQEIFGGALQSQVKCLLCGNESNKVDEIMDISLDVMHSNSLKDALQKFFEPEVLDGNNKYKCGSCKRLVKARKQMSILQAPNVLVIQFKRFEGILGKIDKAIAFEEVLVLSSFMCKASQDLYPDYKLFGTIVHSGISPESGHYYAYIKDAAEQWYCCNDSFVTLSSLQEVLCEKAYMLFFSRTKQRPPSPGRMLSSNGVKSRVCNGNGTENSVKVAHQTKKVNKKPLIENSLVKNVSTIAKVDRVQMKFSLGTSGSKRVTATSNGKLDVHNHKDECIFKIGEVNDVVLSQENCCSMKLDGHKYQDRVKNGNEKYALLAKENDSNMPSSLSRTNEDGVSSFMSMDGINTHGEAHPSINNINRQYPLTNGHGKDRAFSNSSGEGTKPENNVMQNGGIQLHSDNSGSKRKLNYKDNCFLSPQNPDSQALIQALKAELQLEASLVLQSCGWSEKVYSFMQSRKKLCVQASNIESNDNELKKMLIAEAKTKFLSQVPESLKGDLIERLVSFSQKKQTLGP